ncbi:MAG: InlB B-repeat-containing protein [Methanocorpusculum sp.]|nr:InlB B-repeat-containing protein [Methanocorpusculum sp.]MDE2545724.1 InlB B-repeat-containing protein [Methanocorpusculum sp.]
MQLVYLPAAQIGDTKYDTLTAAFEAVADNDQKTITLLRDASGDGVVIKGNKKIILDLSGYTYNVNGETVGSLGTETNGFQLKKGNEILFKNGKITSDKAIILIQNYANLTLENVVLDGSQLKGTKQYTSSNNNGNVMYKSGTKIIAPQNGVAFDVYYWPSNSYTDGVSVTIADANVVIEGLVEFTCDNTEKDHASKAKLIVPQDYNALTLGDVCSTHFPYYCWEAYGTNQKILTHCEPVVPKPPVAEPTKNDNGSVTIIPAGTDTINVDVNAKTATTKNESSGITITIVFNDIAASSGTGSVTGNVSKVDVGYNETPAAAPPSASVPDVPVPGTVSVTLNLTLNNVTTKLPQINTTFNATVADKVKTENPGFHPVAMITAETNVAEINANITTSGDGGIKIVFTVPKAWVDSMGGPNGGRIWSFHADVDGVALRQISSGNIHLKGEFYEITVYGTSFSSHGIVGKVASAPAPQPPQPVYSSGDGNMNNAFRVLFDTKGGSFISPSTGLSYGDKISQPPAPTKDGYTFGGWYKDSACTQSWNFSDSIPGDMTLYAKWTTSSGSQTTTTPAATAQQTTKATPAATQSQTAAAATAAPVTTTAAGVSPTLTKAPAPVCGMLLGLFAAGVLLRRKN